jgi:NADPH:quinone reductase-like Zn-dependent oxidoreductase
MKAVLFREHGGPDVLEVVDVPVPRPGPTEVLLRVRSVSVMRTLDTEVRSRPGFGGIPLPHILGADPAGDVVDVGSAVEGFTPGDRVVSVQILWCGRCTPCSRGLNNACVRLRIQGVHTDGGDAEYAVVPAQNLVPIPDGLSYEDASALVVMHPAAWHLLIDRASLRAGESVLILAAGGALGTAGIQVAKLAGARVIAAAGADWKLEKARELGADEAVNYTSHKLTDEVMRLTDGAGADVVFENLSLPELWPHSLASAAYLGRIVTCGALGGGSVETNMRAFYSKHLSLFGARAAPKAQVAEVFRLAGQGKLKPVVHARYPLEHARAAHEHVSSREVFGRVMLSV